MMIFDYVHITLNALSLISCVILIKHGSQTIGSLNNPKNLVMLLGVSRLTVSLIEILLTLINSQTICFVMGPIRDFANWTAISWSCLMSLWTIMVYKNYSSFQLVEKFKRYCLVVGLVSFFLTLGPILKVGGLSYVYREGFCTMDVLDASAGLRSTIFLLLTGIPFIILLTLTLYASLNVFLFFRNLPRQLAPGYEFSNIKLVQYAIAHLVVYSPDVIDSIIMNLTGNHVGLFGQFGIYCNDLAGLINYIVYHQQFEKKTKESLNNLDSNNTSLLDDMSSPEFFSP